MASNDGAYTGTNTQADEVRESLYLREDGDVSQSLLNLTPGWGLHGNTSNPAITDLNVDGSSKQQRSALKLSRGNVGRKGIAARD